MQRFFSILLLFFALSAAPLYAQWQVAVFPYRNQTGDAQWDWFSRGISEALVNAFYREPHIRVVDETPLQKAAGDDWRDLIGNADLANRLQIHIVLKGAFSLEKGRLVLHTDVVQADNGKIRRAIEGEAPVEKPLDALSSLLLGLPETLEVALQPDAKTALTRPVFTDIDAFRTAMNAVRAFHLAMRHNPPDPSLLSQAEQGFKSALARDPQSALPHYYIGLIDEARDQIPEAETAYRAAIKADFDHVAARYHLSKVLKAQGRASEAMNELEQALQQSPIDPNIQSEMSGIFFNQYAQTFETVSQQLQDAIKAAPNDPDAYYQLGDAYNELYRFDEAAHYFQEALYRDSTLADAHFKLGLIYFRKGEYDEAIQHLYSAIAHNTQFTRVHFRLGNILYDRKCYKEAADQFSQALDAEPNYPIPRYNLGLCQLALGREDDALATFQKYASFTVDDDRPYYQMGEIYRQRGQTGQAMQNYQKAIGLNYISVPPHYRLAYLYAKQGKYADAVRELNAVLSLNPHHPEADAIRRDIARWKSQ